MTVDVDAVNERLNGLVNLLHVVGIDGVDPNALVQEQKRQNDSAAKAAAPSTNANPQLSGNDAAILEIIKKLQLAQADSPEILAALKSPELRALASLAAQQATPPPTQKKGPSLDDVMDDDDNYPKIGPGYSDDVSVFSDISTPTVMTRQHVAEEEYYKEVDGGPGSLPPMHIGGAAQPSRPPAAVGGAAAMPGNHGRNTKTKNLVSSVRPGSRRPVAAAAAAAVTPKAGGAAAQRRLNYQQAMAKLHSSEYGTPKASKEKSYMENFSPKKPPTKFFPTAPATDSDPSQFPSIAEAQNKKRATRSKTAVKSKGRKKALAAQEVADEDFEGTDPAPKNSATSLGSGSRNSRDSKPKVKDDIDWGTSDDGGWPAFDDLTPSTAKTSDNSGFDDGFFSGDAFGGTDPFATTAPAPPSKSSKSPKPSRKERSDDGKSRDRKVRKEKKTKSGSRKASLAM